MYARVYTRHTRAHTRIYPRAFIEPCRWKADLKLRIVQHNIRTVASYYKQINTKRLAELLGLDEAQAERNVAGTHYWSIHSTTTAHGKGCRFPLIYPDLPRRADKFPICTM